MSHSMEDIRRDLTDSAWMSGVACRPSSLQAVGSKVYWLEGAVQDLYVYDLVSKMPPTKLVGSKARTETLSIEEEMERERTRSRAVGIDSFVVSSSNERVLFRSNGKWYLHTIKTDLSMEVFSSFDGSPTNVSVVDKVALSTVSFTSKGNVFIGMLTVLNSELVASWEQVTHIGGQNDLICGEADYVISEEFDRLTGHWVRGDNVIFTISDQSRLDKVHIFGRDANVVEQMPYPRVGDENPTVLICNFNRKTKTFSYLPTSTLTVAGDLATAEYFPKIGFFNDDSVYVQTLSRSQESSRVVVASLDAFIPSEELLLQPLSLLKAPAVDSETISEDNIPFAWVEVTKALHIQIPQNMTKVNLMGKHAVGSTKPFFHLFMQPSSSTTWDQITTGDFNVNPANVSLQGDSLLYMAGSLNYLGSTMCITSTSTKETVSISDEDEYVHSFVPVTEGATLKGIVFVVGTSTRCPALAYYDVELKQRRPLSANWHVGYTSDDWPETASCKHDLVVPEVHFATNKNGTRLPFYSYLPKSDTFAGKRPVLMYVYGGPHVQLVRHGFYDSIFNPLIQAAVSRGVSCIIADNSMCHANDLRTLAVCKKGMGSFETEDYVSVLDAVPNIPKLNAAMDLDRVAISGWSYGGYATLLALSQASATFKLGFAGAPVGDWRLYDTGYTERYMGLLPDATDSYKASAIPTFASGFPDEPLRLFIAHGLTDENVHFSNSCAVVDALTAQGKPFQLQVYPGERHGLRQKPHSFNHYRSQMLATLLKLI